MCTDKGTKPPEVYSPAPPPSYPNQNDLEIAKKYDQSYGDPSAGMLQPGAQMRQIPNLVTSMRATNLDILDKVPRSPIGQEQADTNHIAWIASQRSAVAALGYDPRVMTTSPKKGNEDLQINVNGSYDKKRDEIWTSGQYDSTMVHESFHRGFQKLKKADMLPESAKKLDEETLTRLYMLKHFGDVEMGRGNAGDDQIKYAKSMRNLDAAKYDTALNEVEAAAAILYAKERPRGPR